MSSTRPRRGRAPVGPGVLVALLLLPLLATQVAAYHSDPVGGNEDVRASLLALPLRGLVLLLVISVPAARGWRYVPQRAADHAFLFLEVLLLLGLSGALLAGIAFDGSGNLGLSTAVPAALAALGVHTAAFIRYYRWPTRHAAVAGLGLTLLSVATWYAFARLDTFDRLEAMDLLGYVLPVLVLLLAATLGVQTLKVHLRPRPTGGGPGGPAERPALDGPATGVGTYAELLVANLGLAAVLLCIGWWT